MNGVRQSQTRHRQTGRGAFTLTEILMAVGILGIGLTMVASVFPVAVDQSRQSRDATMAALCARSVAATIRARRFNILDWYHRYIPPTSSDKDKPVPLSELAFAVLPEAWTEYNPESFLYDQTIIDGTTTHDRVYNPTLIQPLWLAGNFVATVFITPIAAGGPYRLTIAVFKSRGKKPINNKPYSLTAGSNTNPIVPGEYLYDTNAFRGEAYRLDYINPPTGNIKLYPTLPKTQGGDTDTYPIPPDSPRYFTLPEAVAVYHTIVGD